MIDPILAAGLLSPIQNAKRASGVYLPLGKRPSRGPEAIAASRALKEAQLDIGDAIEAVGGDRGHMGR